MCIEILRNPSQALAKAKKSKGYNYAIRVLLEASLLMAVAFALASAGVASYTAVAAIGGIIFSLTILLSVFLSFVLNLFAGVLGRAHYAHALTAVVYSVVFLAAGFLAGALLLYLPAAGSILAVLVVIPFLAMSFAVLYSGLKELLGLDSVSAFAAVLFSVLAMFLAVFAMRLLVAFSAMGYYF